MIRGNSSARAKPRTTDAHHDASGVCIKKRRLLWGDGAVSLLTKIANLSWFASFAIVPYSAL